MRARRLSRRPLSDHGMREKPVLVCWRNPSDTRRSNTLVQWTPVARSDTPGQLSLAIPAFLGTRLARAPSAHPTAESFAPFVPVEWSDGATRYQGLIDARSETRDDSVSPSVVWCCHSEDGASSRDRTICASHTKTTGWTACRRRPEHALLGGGGVVARASRSSASIIRREPWDTWRSNAGS
jgi:hypothetical protein